MLLNGRGVSRSGSGLPKFNPGFRAVCQLLDLCADLDDADAGVLPHGIRAATAEREQHRVGGQGRMSHERRFLPGIEEAYPELMVRAVRREHEGDFGASELAGYGLQGVVVEAVGVEYDGGGIAGEAGGCKCIYLKNPQVYLRSL